MKPYHIFYSLLLFYFLCIVIYTSQLITDIPERLIYLLIIGFSLWGVYVESIHGKYDHEAKKIKNYACEENSRIAWTRAVAICILPFFFVSIFYPNVKQNILYFLISFFCVYFYFNWDNYHRSRIVCDMSRNKDVVI